MVLSVVSVGAHQDDELSCLGTLILCAARGDRITTVSISRGDLGGQHDPAIPHDEIARIRIAEASAVASSLGGEYFCLGSDDEFIMDTQETRVAVARVLRRVRADLVLTPPPTDYNVDHIRAGEITAHAALLSAINTLDIGEAPLPRAPVVMYMDSIVGLDFQPTHYVDVSTVFAQKCELLRLHASQMQSQPNITGWDLVAHAEAVGRLRGMQCSVRYAEGFRPVLRTPLVRPGSLLPEGGAGG
jgi:LmbE family N-acetylglucosaminyl deacetylase